MLIVPAIDIIGGKCVRLTQGDYSKKKVYSSDPLEVALGFQKKNAEILNVIDLDGAKNGFPQNFELVRKLVETVEISVQVGGGIRTTEDIRRYIDIGVARVILGTRVVSDSAFLKAVIDEFGADRVVVSVDVKNRKVGMNGWISFSDIDYLEFAKKLSGCGVKFILCTDISSDGTLKNPDLNIFEELVNFGFNVFAAGGVSDLSMLKKLKSAGVYGAVVGKAIYEGKLKLKDFADELSDEFDAGVCGESFLAKRIIPCLDVKEGRVVKGVNFENLADAGDPVELAKKYSENGADELVFLDISASKNRRKIMLDMVRRVAENIFIPFTVGGGISCIQDIRDVLSNGADKISINTAAIKNPMLISDAAENFGSQCVVVAIDVKKIRSKYKVFIKGGSEETDLEAVSWAKTAQNLGAGEILLTSMDRDGTCNGFDNYILRKVSDALNIPVIASGGGGTLSHLKDGIKIGNADAVLAAGIFHYNKYSIDEVKQYLVRNEVQVRL